MSEVVSWKHISTHDHHGLGIPRTERLGGMQVVVRAEHRWWARQQSCGGLGYGEVAAGSRCEFRPTPRVCLMAASCYAAAGSVYLPCRGSKMCSGKVLGAVWACANEEDEKTPPVFGPGVTHSTLDDARSRSFPDRHSTNDLPRAGLHLGCPQATFRTFASTLLLPCFLTISLRNQTK